MNTLQPNDGEGFPIRKKNGPTKQIVVMLAMVALLTVLIVWIKSIGDHGIIPGIKPPKSTPAPKMDAAVFEAKWPQIVTNAAAPARGNPNTRYTIAEFGDFQCPQCGKVYPILEGFLQKYPAKVNLLFLHRPFPHLHQWAVSSGQASEIAAASGKFWPMYDTLYSNQDNLETGYYSTYAQTIGLNKDKFKAAFDSGQGLPQMKTASAFADSLNVQETPTILLRDNTQKTVKIYVGTLGTKNPDGSVQYPGVQSLVDNPPWGR